MFYDDDDDDVITVRFDFSEVVGRCHSDVNDLYNGRKQMRRVSERLKPPKLNYPRY